MPKYGDMAGFEQSLGLSLQQTLSPQMQQSLQVLQAPVLELRNLVEQELQVNPVLEEEPPEREQETDGGDEWDDELREISRLDEEWRDYMSQSGAYEGRSAEAQERREFLFSSLHTPKSLQQHLVDQLTLSDLSEEDREVASAIVGNLNEAGLLDVTVPELAGMTNVWPEQVERVLREVQSLDPVGVAARDLRECLLIQLERMGKRESLEARIVNGHLDELLKRRFPEIARRLGVSVQDIQAAADFISTLEPRPARQFSSAIEQVIQPDVVVESDGEGGFLVALNNEHIPMLRISNYYKDLLSEPASRGQVRDYIREKIKGGRFFIKCIQQRQQTILNIAREIIRRQEDFLREGPSGLKPMTMNQVAQAVGVHETTVSRATHGKYMLTPQGIFEMKYFFTPGYQTDTGSDISNESVRRAIVEVVEKEDKRRPLSDQAILEILKERGIPIARRTVAKYREQLDILPSHLRKTF
ncbi:MAG TPA: RNA polymerase factor sigma-54 [Chthoniobacterales bacterium]